MAEHHLARQPELEPELAHFVLEQLAQRLEQLEVQRLGQPADVVMRLDRVRLLGLGAGRLDHVRIDRSLREPLRRSASFAASRWNTSTNSRPMILRFCSGSVDAGERGQELVAGVDVDHAHAEVARERLHHLLGLVQAQQAVIDEHAGQLVADRPVDQRRGDRRIDAAGQARGSLRRRRPARGSRDRLADVVVHVPVVAAAADVVREAREDRRALLRVRDFRMELHARRSCAPRRPSPAIAHASTTPISLKPGRQRGDLVAVAHPHVEQAVAFGVARGPAMSRSSAECPRARTSA